MALAGLTTAFLRSTTCCQGGKTTVREFVVGVAVIGVMTLASSSALAQKASPCAAKNPCAARAANPCGAKNPCAVKNPCAAATQPAAATRQAPRNFAPSRVTADRLSEFQGL